MSEVSFSIITVTFNAAKTIRRCLESVTAQQLSLQHLVIDGVSKDDTATIVREYRGHPVSLIVEPDRGLYDALNKGIHKATGEVVGILHADDCYASETALRKVRHAFADGSVDACYADLEYVDRDATGMLQVVRYWRSGTYSQGSFYNGWMPPHPTFFVRRRVYDQLGAFNLDLGSAADYELMLRFLLRHRIKTVYMPEILVLMAMGGVSNASIRSRIEANRKDRLAWRVNGLVPRPWTLFAKPLRKLPQYILRPTGGVVARAAESKCWVNSSEVDAAARRRST